MKYLRVELFLMNGWVDGLLWKGGVGREVSDVFDRGEIF